MSSTPKPAAFSAFIQLASVFLFQVGRFGKFLSLPMQLSTRMLWCGVLTTYDWKHNTTLPLALSYPPGASQERFSPRVSFDKVGRKSSIGVKPLSCSTIRWMVMSLTEKLVRIARVSSPVGCPALPAIVAQPGADDERRL